MTETWRPVPRYEDRYEVSTEGHVRRSTGRVLKPSKRGRTDHLSVMLFDSERNPKSPENTIQRGGTHGRGCRKCRLAAKARYRARQRV